MVRVLSVFINFSILSINFYFYIHKYVLIYFLDPNTKSKMRRCLRNFMRTITGSWNKPNKLHYQSNEDKINGLLSGVREIKSMG